MKRFLRLFLQWLLARVQGAIADRTPSAYSGPQCDMCDGSLIDGWFKATDPRLTSQGGHVFCAPCADDIRRNGFLVELRRRFP